MFETKRANTISEIIIRCNLVQLSMINKKINQWGKRKPR